MFKILLVENDELDGKAFMRLVSQESLPYDYLIVQSVSAAASILEQKHFDIIIIDYRLGDGTGLDVLKLIPANLPAIIITGAGSEEVAVEAMRSGASDYLIKDTERTYLKLLPLIIERTIRARADEKKHLILSHAIMSIEESIIVTDLDGTISYVNATFCDTYQYKEEEIVGRNHTTLYPPHTDVLPLDHTLAYEGEHLRRDGTCFSASILQSKIVDNKGSEIAFVIAVRDITNRKIEQQLRASEENFRTTFEQMAVGIAHVATDGSWLRVNQKLCEILGYTSEDLLEKTFQDITHPDDLDLDLLYVNQLLSGEIPTYSMEKRYIHQNGNHVWVNLSVSLVRDASGEPIQFISVIQDMTKRKKLEEEIRQHRNQLEVLVAERTYELQEKNTELEKEMQEREDIERELKQLRDERNRQTLENIAKPARTSLTARSFGSLSLRESAPMNFDELVENYGTLIDLALEQQVYRVNHGISQKLRALAEEMGATRATPRDVIEIHDTTLKRKSDGSTLQRAEAYIEEGRLILLELMGYLTAYYRRYSFGTNKFNTREGKRSGDKNE